jgi:hypothetical protein
MKLVLLLLVVVAATACAAPVADVGPLSIDAGDATAIVEACGKGPIAGYSYCRFTEGALTTGEILVHVPAGPLSSVLFVGPDGEGKLIVESAGKTPVVMRWDQLLKSPTFLRAHRGFWIVLVRTTLTDGTFVVAEGEIRVRVLAEGYQSLDGSWEPSQCAWRWPLKTLRGPGEGCLTLAGRTSVRLP